MRMTIILIGYHNFIDKDRSIILSHLLIIIYQNNGKREGLNIEDKAFEVRCPEIGNTPKEEPCCKRGQS